MHHLAHACTILCCSEVVAALEDAVCCCRYNTCWAPNGQHNDGSVDPTTYDFCENLRQRLQTLSKKTSRGSPVTESIKCGLKRLCCRPYAAKTRNDEGWKEEVKTAFEEWSTQITKEVHYADEVAWKQFLLGESDYVEPTSLDPTTAANIAKFLCSQPEEVQNAAAAVLQLKPDQRQKALYDDESLDFDQVTPVPVLALDCCNTSNA